ncbi:hypothetical protein WVIC16_110144 [Weissella viridescens]|nr:hypothetical protein WVIC16_110144 [Weissella viridescens]
MNQYFFAPLLKQLTHVINSITRAAITIAKPTLNFFIFRTPLYNEPYIFQPLLQTYILLIYFIIYFCLSYKLFLIKILNCRFVT